MLQAPRLAAYILSAVVLTLLGGIVLANNRKSQRNRIFAAFMLSVDLWVIALAVADNTNSLVVAEFASRLAFAAASIVFLFVAYLALVFSRKSAKNSPLSAILVVPALALVATAPTKLSVVSVSIERYGASVVGGLAYQIFSIYALIYLVIALVLLNSGLKRANGSEKQQIRYLMYGLILSTFFALLTNLVFVDYAYLGPPSLLIFALSTTVAIVRHRLFDVRLIVARSVAYILLLGTLAVLYGGALFGIGS